MNVFFKQLVSDKITWWGTMVSFLLLLISLIYVLFFYYRLPSLVPVYNQLPWGPSRLGHRIDIFLPLGITLIIFVGNIFFARFLYERMPLASRMISITTALISLLTLLFVVHIVQLIT